MQIEFLAGKRNKIPTYKNKPLLEGQELYPFTPTDLAIKILWTAMGLTSKTTLTTLMSSGIVHG